MTHVKKKTLPSDLRNLPLVSAICEIRVVPTLGLSNVIPGVIFSKLPGAKKINRLPAMEIPAQFRAADDMKFTPLVNIQCEGYAVSVSDNSLIIECGMPYSNWTTFKSYIVQVVNACFPDGEPGLIAKVERYSLKYDDIIESPDSKDWISPLNASISIGDFRAGASGFFARLEAMNDGIVYIVNVAAPARILAPIVKPREGVLVSIDTIRELNGQDPAEFKKTLETSLDSLHKVNKAKFFDCITDETLELLEPVYDDLVQH